MNTEKTGVPQARPLGDNLRPRDAAAAAAALTWTLVVLVTLSVIRLTYWWISGDDGYYHIEVAAELRRLGTPYLKGLPWVRLSVFSDAWGDKELLFHWFLVPFAWGGLLLGAKIALSLLNGLTAGAIAFLGVRVAGRAGWFAPLLVLAVNTHFPVRMDQLRPHNLSLILLLLLAHEIIGRRRWSLALLGFLYPLAYTAWQAPILLCLACFVAFAAVRREWRWELLYVPIAGVLAGILVHPGFPDNISVWSLQNLTFFQQKGLLPVGTEIYAESARGFLRSNGTGLALVGLLALSRRPRWRHGVRDEDLVLGTFALTTLMLFLGAIRFAEYAVPFTCLFGLALYRALEPRRWVAAVGALPRAALWLVAIGGGAVLHVRETVLVLRQNHTLAFLSPDDVRTFRSALPPGATVASTWDFTPYYIFAAPQARYLNVLDPVFMAARYPALYDTLELIHSGAIADIPAALSGGLDSDFIAYNAILFPALARRSLKDPRLVPVFNSPNHQLDRVDRMSDFGFVTDWRIDPVSTPDFARYAAARDTVTAPILLPSYDGRDARALVSLRDAVPAGCWWARRDFAPLREGSRVAYFSSAGRAAVYLDARRIHESEVGDAGVVDAVRLNLGASDTRPQEVAVFTCADPTFGAGFFWRESAPSR